MATKKHKKKKVIDGIVKNPKNTKKSTAKKPADVEVKSETIKVTPDDTTVAIIEAEDITENPDKEIVEEAIVDEPAVEIEEVVEESPVEDTENEEAESDAESEESASEAVEITINSPEDGENLTRNAIMDEEAIDENLDELISDIEEDEKKAEDKAVDEIAKTEKSEPKIQPEKTKAKVKAKPFRIISRILAFLSLGAVASAVVRIILTGIVPNKYLIPAIAILAIFFLFYIFKTFRKKTHIWMLIILTILGVALGAVSVFGFVKVQETMSFLFRNFNENKEYTIYNVIVNKDSNYTSLDDVKGKTFHSISDFVDTEKLETAAKEQANASIVYADGISSLLKETYDDKTYIAVLNAGTWDATLGLNDGKNDYVGKYKVIGELNVDEENKNDEASQKSDLTTDSFTVYVSGIDTRTGLMLDRSLSDVNMVITVNPKTKHILMTTIPRDYYVQLHGTSGLRDKLTHAGSLGGLELSMATIEDLLDFKFSRYIRVNFNFVVNLVNAVGGITVNSDVNYTFTTLHPEDRKCTFVPGPNTIDGECALGFARERYAYADGDRHRGRNQEQVIEKIFEKLTSSTTLISRYSDILNSLNGSFDTNISASDITSLANMQLNDMAKWTVETYNCDGTTGGAFTYSYPNQTLSVMYPDETTVETAKAKIKQVLAGTTEAAPAETTETTETTITEPETH